jgi:hypothetical protein
MKQNILLSVVSVLALSACGEVKFSPKPMVATDNSSERIAGPDPVCGDPDQPPHSVWIGADPVTVACPDLCPDGTARECTQNRERELVCIEGYPQVTDHLRPAGQPAPAGLCPALPLDCGSHAHNSVWWAESGSRSQTCEVCADGSDHRCLKAVEKEMRCVNGVESLTGAERSGRFLSYENECLPPQPKACGDHAHQSFWWEEVDKEREECQSCWDGSKLSCEYAVEGQKLCIDGQTQNAGFSRRGRLLGVIGACPAQPKNCGSLAHNASEWRVNGQGNPYDCEVCIDGSTRKCVKAREEQVLCKDGALELTGQTREGAFIGYLNNCPTDIAEKFETVNVTASGGKADVLFILDTTPSMFLSLNNLGTKFNQLISSWTNIDWQVAVTNAKVEKSFFDPYVLDGKFIELQKNDMTKPVEYIIKKNEYFAEPWFYRTVSRDPSDNGCESQPYCMNQPPEPLRALKAAIDKKSAPTNKGFFRDQSKLVVVIVSDADEREVGAEDKKATTPADAKKYVESKLPKMDGVVALSVIVKPGDSKCLARHQNIFDLGAGGRYGAMLDEFAKMTGGLSASVCDEDFGPALSKLSEAVRQQIESIELKEVPVTGSLKLTFTPQFSGTWSLQGKKVLFSKPVPKGTRIDVRYLVKVSN